MHEVIVELDQYQIIKWLNINKYYIIWNKQYTYYLGLMWTLKCLNIEMFVIDMIKPIHYDNYYHDSIFVWNHASFIIALLLIVYAFKFITIVMIY